ncbi:MAG: hypothetical protein ABI193_15955 [Minicystis sp.]
MLVSLIVLLGALLLILGGFTVVTGRRLRARLADTEARLLAERAVREQVKGELVERRQEAEALVLAERTEREGERGTLEGQLDEVARRATTAAEEKRALEAQLAASHRESDTRAQELARLRPELAQQSARIEKARAEEKARYDKMLHERLAPELALREQLADETQLARDEAFRERNARESFTFEMRSIRGEMQRLTQKLGEETTLREQLQRRLDERDRALEQSGSRVHSLEAALKSWEPVKADAPAPTRLSMWWCTDCDQGGLVTNKPHKCPPKKPVP